MTAPPMRDQLKRYYDAKEPPAEFLSELLDQVQTPARPRRRRWVLAAAAALVLGATGTWLATPRPAPSPAIQSFAREVARHYLVCTDGEPVPDVAAAAAHLSRLDFPLVEPPCLEEEDLHVRGVRHCVLRDQVMAELRLEDSTGRPALLCMTRQPTQLAGTAEVEVDGLRVRIWSHAGLLMGLARPA